MQKEQDIDEFFMRQALIQAQMAFEKGEVPIGAVISGGGHVIARAHNLVETLRDSTAHAEMQCLTAATASIGGKYLVNCTLYVTVEPCPMCAAATRWCQVGRIVWGASDAKAGYLQSGGALLHPKTQTRAGVLESECSQLMQDFFRKLRLSAR